jgi:hypothetical protein
MAEDGKCYDIGCRDECCVCATHNSTVVVTFGTLGKRTQPGELVPSRATMMSGATCQVPKCTKSATILDWPTLTMEPH